MKKKRIAALFSFIISAVFLAEMIYVVVGIFMAPARNFGIIWILPTLASAVVYALTGTNLIADKMTREKAELLFIIALISSLAPAVIFSIILSPAIFLTFRITDIVLFFAPVVLCVFPLIIFLKSK